MADSSARDGHTSDSRATSAIVCVCTTRLPLKMQARPATPGFEGCSQRKRYVTAAPTSALSNEPSVPEGQPAKRRPMQRYARQGAGRDARSVCRCSWELKNERGVCLEVLRGSPQSDVSPTASFADFYKGSFANVVTCTRHTKREMLTGSHSHLS